MDKETVEYIFTLGETMGRLAAGNDAAGEEVYYWRSLFLEQNADMLAGVGKDKEQRITSIFLATPSSRLKTRNMIEFLEKLRADIQ